MLYTAHTIHALLLPHPTPLQQQPPAVFCSTFCPSPLIVDLPPDPEAIEVFPMLVANQRDDLKQSGEVAHRSLICFDMVKNACSTLVAFLADVSRKGIPSSSAKAWAGSRRQ